MIAIVGATGRLGRDLVRRLLSEGETVAAVTRSPGSAEDLMRLGAEVREADLTDAASVARACRGVTHVVSAAHAILGRGRNRSEHVDDAGHCNLVDAARAAGVTHFVYTSALGASPSHPVDFWRTKHKVERHLEASGMPFTIVRPGAFMEMHAHELIGKGILANGSATILGSGTARINYVAVRDVAALVVHVLHDPSARGETIEIGGPENLTARDVAAIYGRVAERAVKTRHVPAAALRVLSAIMGPLHPGVARVMFASAAVDGVHDAFVPTPTHARYPIELTRLEDFAREQRDRGVTPT